MLRAGLQTPRGRSQLWAGPTDFAGRYTIAGRSIWPRWPAGRPGNIPIVPTATPPLVITDPLHSLLHSYLSHFASLNRCPRCQITLTVRLSDQQWAVDWGAGPYIEERAPWCHRVPPGYAGPKQRGMLICCRRQQVCCWLHSLEYASNKFKFKPLK